MNENKFEVKVTDMNVVTLTFTHEPSHTIELTTNEADQLSVLLRNATYNSGKYASTDRNQFVEALNLQDEPTDPLKLIKQWKASIAKTRDSNGKRYWLCSGQLILATVLESWYLTSDSFGAKPAL